MRAIAIILLISTQAIAQSFIPTDDISIRVNWVQAQNLIRVAGEHGECTVEAKGLQTGHHYFYCVEPMGSSGSMIWIWEFTSIVSMGNFESKYWVGVAQRIHYIDSQKIQSLIPQEEFQIRFYGSFIERPNSGVLQLNGILGFSRPKGGSTLKFDVRRL